MMATDNPHYGIAFATRYALGVARGNFNVATALDRLRVLSDDIGKVDAAVGMAREREEQEDGDFHRFSEIEAFSFYAVGIVTCLEWHARSRLTDLFTFVPSSIEPDDLKPLANARMMAQMVENDVSAAQLLGGLTNVASAEKYLGVIKRVYEALGIPASPHEIVNEKVEHPKLFDIGSGMETLSRIFEFRNAFVHEIGLDVRGSYSMRDGLTAGTASDWCQFAIRCVRELEAPITAHAPSHFPNCIDEYGHARNDLEGLDAFIAATEADLTRAFESKDRGLAGWHKALPLSRVALATESEMCGDLYTRLFENAAPARTALRSARISYLQALRNALESLPDKS